MHTAKWVGVVVAAVVALAACGTDQPSSIRVRGTLGADFAVSTARGGPLAATKTVRSIVALPHHRGQITLDMLPLAVTQTLSSDAFELELSTDYDWLLLLLDESARALDERIKGYVALGHTDGEGLVYLPASRATGDLDLGELEQVGDSAQSDGRLADSSQSFSLSYDTLLELATMDDAFEHLANLYLNWRDPIHYSATQVFGWRAPLAGIDAASPDDYVFQGYQVGVFTNDPAVRDAYDDICAGAVDFALTVPGETRTDAGSYYGPGNPLRNSEPRESYPDSCSTGEIGLYPHPDEIQLGFPVGGTFQLAADGYWTLELAGETVAAFDLARAVPVDDATQRALVPVPLPRLSRDANGLVVDVDWYHYDAVTGDYARSHPAVLEQLITYSAVLLQSVNEETLMDEARDPDPVITHAVFHGDWPADQILDLTVALQLAGNDYQFTWTGRPYCGNGAIDDGELCDGGNLSGATCLTQGFNGGQLGCTSNCRRSTDVCNPAVTGAWTSTGDLSVSRMSPHAFRLAGDRVLVFGGGNATAEVWDPGTGQFSPAGSMSDARGGSRAIRLADGRILVTGGRVGSASATASTEIWDPATESFSAGPDMAQARQNHAVALRSDGTVLITGGSNADAQFLSSAEIMDVSAGSSVLTAAELPHPRDLHDAVTLADGRVLLVGGYEQLPITGGTTALPSDSIVEVSDGPDPSFDAWPRPDGVLQQGRVFHTTTLLTDGRVLVAGGETLNGVRTRTAELLDPDARRVVMAEESMSAVRERYTATRLSTGHVLMVGGLRNPNPANDCAACVAADVFYQVPTHFAPAAPMLRELTQHAAVLLGNNDVLVIGGDNRLYNNTDVYLFSP